MSTFMYGVLTSKRQIAEADKSTTDKPPGVKVYADAAAALVPAEVLVLSAVITGIVAKVTTVGDTTTVEYQDELAIKIAFIALIVLAALAYLAGRISAGKVDKLDLVRMLIPAGAFVCWGMLTQASGSEVLFPDLSAVRREVIAVIVAFALGLLAALLGYKLDRQPADPSA